MQNIIKQDYIHIHMNYKDLLQNMSFLQWRLAPTEELDSYWNRLKTENPQLEDEIRKADTYLKKRYFNQNYLNPQEQSLLFEQILTTVNGRKKTLKRSKKITLWVTAASIASVVIFMTLLVHRFADSFFHSSREQIVVSTLQSEDIQLFVGGEKSTFSQNIDLEISAEGVAKVKGITGENSQFKMASHTLNKMVVPFGKRSSIVLSDGTKVWLNSGSELEFPSSFENAKTREIQLRGEMYVEVTPNKAKPFLVKTNQFTVQVLGTKFNVSAYSNAKPSVVLAEGAVQLSSIRETIQMTPNHLAECDDAGYFMLQTARADEYISWINGYLILNQTPISDVLESLGRYYNVKFEFDKNSRILQKKCIGKLYLSDNLDDVINTIAILGDASYSRNGNTILLKNK